VRRALTTLSGTSHHPMRSPATATPSAPTCCRSATASSPGTSNSRSVTPSSSSAPRASTTCTFAHALLQRAPLTCRAASPATTSTT
jgi:hypothetical protein